MQHSDSIIKSNRCKNRSKLRNRTKEERTGATAKKGLQARDVKLGKTYVLIEMLYN